MSKPKKHPFVPQGYLRFFAEINEQGDHIITVHDKVLNKTFSSNIANIAEKHNYNLVEKGMFYMPAPNDDPLYYESKYTELIEGNIPQIIAEIVSICNLLQTKSVVLNSRRKKDLSRFIVTQLLRSSLCREYSYQHLSDVCMNTVNAIRCTVLNMNDKEKQSEFLNAMDSFSYNPKFFNSFWLYIITDEDRLNNFSNFLINNRVWVIYNKKLSDIIPFVTSDSPVVQYNMSTKQLGYNGNAIDNANTAIFIPITPKYVIALYHKDKYPGKQMGIYDSSCISVDEPKFIINLNDYQYQQCERQTFEKPDKLR